MTQENEKKAAGLLQEELENVNGGARHRRK